MNLARFLPTALLSLVALSPLAGCGSSESPAEVTASIQGSKQDEGGSPRKKVPQGPTKPAVRVDTSLGSFVVELEPEKAPLTVENFLAYVEAGHYDQTLFHQVVDGYIALGGGFTTQMVEKPTRTPIRNEAHNGQQNVRGTIAMARQFDVIDSSTCQFFINLADNPSLDHKDRTVEDYGYCVFGKVVEGMDVLDKISKVPVRDTQDFEPAQPVVIRSAQRIR